ncbi:MAG: bifunctional 5,10-methylenetetrahydrofolate dehydrogenase/5,10-methenyltetrahydrofolate cyclohydrolase [Chitinophagales bacterium]|nr:bifunctional 5,10-methylenetetrahydrofolate dehydrogenase/5,10-methenyltetrahydrofolate cyclohydrolase [Bacteroidota bacterium]
MQILDGKALAATIKEEIKISVADLLKSEGIQPHLAAILVGDNAASKAYVGNKVKMCEAVGFRSTLVHLPADISEKVLLEQINNLNNDASVHGFIVQLPLPEHINVATITQAIDYRKDVDGFHPINIGRMVENLSCYLPATPWGIVQMLERYQIATSGKHCVVIGRSNIVGMPVSILLARNAQPGNCTVTITHSRTQNLAEIVRTADIIIAAIGKPHFVTADMVKKDAVVIDVGINRVKADDTKSGFRLVGDVDFENVAPQCTAITPVPGGVGPMTVVSLMLNTLKAARRQVYLR